MNRLAVGFGSFELISERVSPEVLQFVALQTGSLCLECGDFAFKVTYLPQQVGALILRGKDAVIGLNDLALKFNELRLKRGSVAQT